MATYGEMKRAAEIAAARVRPRSLLGFEELVQEAWVAALEARERFDPDRGTPFAAYATKAGQFRCERASWRTVRDRERRETLELREEWEAKQPEKDPGDRLDHRAWRRAVRAEVRKVLASSGPRQADALRLVLRSATAGEIAEERGVKPQQVFNESWEIRRALRESSELQRLWRDRA